MKKLIIFLLLIVVVVLGFLLHHMLTNKAVTGSWSLYKIEDSTNYIENGNWVNIEFLKNGKAKVKTPFIEKDMDHDQGKHEIKGDFGFLGTVLGITGLNLNTTVTYNIDGKEMEVNFNGSKLYFKLVENGAAPMPTGKLTLSSINGATDEVNQKIAADGKVQIEFVGNKVKYTHGSSSFELECNTVTNKVTGAFANIGFDLVNTYGAQMDLSATEAAYMYDNDVFCIRIGDMTLVFRQK